MYGHPASTALHMIEGMNSFTMVEFPTASARESAEFFGAVFGWAGTLYGPEYRAAGSPPRCT
ncbi:hypothetical protein AC230_20670 [Streptomyces caatingaensis]|uniref:Uncharacterized protein n=1 Tax=Streptomyces caatingaensis TaxID=1678637 RepID=A0A0K9XCB6_9ACTN|nr:hypothetical protein AC230_20670 [Streptomyces caatingaensis]